MWSDFFFDIFYNILKHKAVQVITIVFLLFIGWIVYSADVGNQTVFFKLVNAIPYGDKIGHFFLFGLLTLLLNLALNFKSLNFKKSLPLGTVIVSVFVLLEEMSQVLFPNRTLDIIDLIADGLGIITFTFLGYFIFQHKVWCESDIT